jgi:hypothetical protein
MDCGGFGQVGGRGRLWARCVPHGAARRVDGRVLAAPLLVSGVFRAGGLHSDGLLHATGKGDLGMACGCTVEVAWAAETGRRPEASKDLV